MRGCYPRPVDTTLLADPIDHGPLRPDDGLLRSPHGVWPVLGGVPVLVPEPAAFLAAHRVPILAALAEAGRATRAEVDRLDAFADAVVGVGAAAIPDDFLEDEEAVPLPPGEGAARDALAAFLLAARASSLHARLATLCETGPVLEVGCGAGPLTRRIPGRPLVVVDRSIRAVLRATGGVDALGVVGLAEQLPVADRAFGTVVAANLVDLLDDPLAFLEAAARALRPGGQLVLTTPDPGLGLRGSDSTVGELVVTAGLEVVAADEDFPWVRSHGPRHHEVYVVRILVARKPRRRR